MLRKLSQAKKIDFAEPNMIVYADEIKPPKDMYWLTQWALHNIGQDSPSGTQGRGRSRHCDAQGLETL